MLKPRHRWVEIIGLVVAIGGAAGALGKWVFTAPTEAEFKDHESRLKATEQGQAVTNAKIDGMRDDVAGIKASQTDLKVDIRDIRGLLERRR